MKNMKAVWSKQVNIGNEYTKVWLEFNIKKLQFILYQLFESYSRENSLDNFRIKRNEPNFSY